MLTGNIFCFNCHHKMFSYCCSLMTLNSTYTHRKYKYAFGFVHIKLVLIAWLMGSIIVTIRITLAQQQQQIECQKFFYIQQKYRFTCLEATVELKMVMCKIMRLWYLHLFRFLSSWKKIIAIVSAFNSSEC